MGKSAGWEWPLLVRQHGLVLVTLDPRQCAHLYNLQEIHFRHRGPVDPTTRAAMLVSLVMEHFFFVPRRALRVQLAGLRDLLRASGTPTAIIEAVPKDPRAAAAHFRIDGITRQYLSCPVCYCLYPYDGPDHPTVTHCTYKKTPESSPCTTTLWKTYDIGRSPTRLVPCRKYLHQDLKYWLGRLLSRVQMENIIDDYPLGLLADHGGPVHDIWQSKVFSRLRDASGQPFFPGPTAEGRVVFSLSVDGFNPFHMKTAKQTASSTCIWLVLLNLPPHLRYLPENILLVGVIPGPGKPSTVQINHALKLVVEDLLEFWGDGVFFSRTSKSLNGRVFRAMLVPLVADMLAARQVLGLPGTTTAHYLCTFCDIDGDDIDVFDSDEWPAKDCDHIRRVAALWQNARSEKDQEALFAAFGLRWSALLDLPYWNPVLYAVIDSMHALDLNLFQNHCRTLFRINIDHAGGSGLASTPAPTKTKRATDAEGQKLLKGCSLIIHANEETMVYRLLDFPRKVLYTVCEDNNIYGDGRTIVIGTKWVLARNIFRWVRFMTCRFPLNG